MKSLVFGLLMLLSSASHAVDLLPSWNEGASRTQLLKYLSDIETAEIPITERVAVFDNDGTLWVEQPNYVQAYFVTARIKELAPQHPEWKDTPPYSYILSDNLEEIAKLSEADFSKLIAATHSGMSVEEFKKIVKQWLLTAVHPVYGKPFTKCVYQPMVELLQALRLRGFKTYIVTGGGIDFVRAFAEEAYGVPPEQVVGSAGKTTFVKEGLATSLIKEPELLAISDGPGKPEQINLHIGRRPIFAAGNSDGDQQMLEYTDTGEPGRFMLLVHHDDPKREFGYDRESPIGRLDKAWDEAVQRNWLVLSMKNDFKQMFPSN